MATQVWLHPTDSTAKPIYVMQEIAPLVSPAPAGNAVVPAGYIRQMGADGFRDTGGITVNGVPMPNITDPGMPYYTGVLFPVVGYDPAAGRPYHTPPNVNRKDGIND